MACKGCSRRSSKRNGLVSGLTPPDTAVDFSILGPTQTRIRSGNGQQYSIFSPLVKMRPPTGWSIWVSVKSHKYFIEGDNARDVVASITSIYNTNDIELEDKVVWFNANRIWIKRMSPRHSHATEADMNAIAELLIDPLIWNSEKWDAAKAAINATDYSEELVRVEVKKLFDLAGDKIIGCETCYDELTESEINYDDQELMKEWVEERYKNIVEAANA